MIERILCPFHKERTPSCVIYPEGYKCYGCGAAGKLEELGIVAPVEQERYVEDVESSIARIKSLPIRPLRGLSFHCDSEFYYLVWPNDTYYIRRHLAPSVGVSQKYKCPAGVPRPMYVANLTDDQQHLFVVEGEINARSIAEACPAANCVSPGSAGDFYAKGRIARDLDSYKRYHSITLVADKDAPGAIACIELKSILTRYVADVRILLMEEDANDILVKYGKEKLKESLGVS